MKYTISGYNINRGDRNEFTSNDIMVTSNSSIYNTNISFIITNSWSC